MKVDGPLVIESLQTALQELEGMYDLEPNSTYAAVQVRDVRGERGKRTDR